MQGDAAEAELIRRDLDAMDGGRMFHDCAEERDVDTDREGASTALGAALGEIDQEFPGDMVDLGLADVLPQAEQGMLLAAADPASEFEQVGQMQIDQMADGRACGRLDVTDRWGVRLRPWQQRRLALVDGALLLPCPYIGEGLAWERL